MFDILLWFFNISININIWDNKNAKTENEPAILIVHTNILLLMYDFLLYSLLKDTKVTGLDKKTKQYIFFLVTLEIMMSQCQCENVARFLCAVLENSELKQFFNSVSLDSNKAGTKFSSCNKATLKYLHSCHITNSCGRNNSTFCY